MKTLDAIKWRYATKKFDNNRKISADKLEDLEEAIRLSPSSYGLQLFEVLRIDNPKIREGLRPHCWNQSQITDASHLYVFCNYVNYNEKDIDTIIRLKAEALKKSKSDFQGYKDFVSKKLQEKGKDEFSCWTGKQTYIALANVITTAASLEIDSCPIEGFERDEVNSYLDLGSKNLSAAVMLAVGYRSEEDANQHAPKVRKSKEELITIL